MCALLNDYLEGKTNASVKRGRAARRAQQVTFVFSEQGLQWALMGLDSYFRFPVFRTSFDECDHEIRECAGWSIADVLSWPESKVRNPVYAHPALFALQVSLAKLWQSWGIAASSVLGSGIGEVAASHSAGILSLETATRIAILRGILSGFGAEKGKVAIVHQGQSDLAEQLGTFAGSVSIVYVNSPRLAVVRGEIAEVDALVARLRDCVVESRPLRIDCFSNESQMQECAANLFAELGPIPQQPARGLMISTVTGGQVVAGDLDTGYWTGNLLQPVLLAEAVRTAEAKGAHTFLEIGPHPVLGSIAESLGPATAARRLIAPMPRDLSQSDSLISALGDLYVEGFSVAWDRVYTVLTSPVTLPSYPYQRKRIWH
jgi:acyl transferase domain-containing protein